MTKRAWRRGSLVVVLCALAAAPAQPQAEDDRGGFESPIVVGSEVRLRAGSLPHGLRGTVVEMDDRTLIVSRDQRAVRVFRADITRLEVGNGRKRNALKGVLIGSVIGGGMFAAIPRDEYCTDYIDDGERCPGRPEMVMTGVLGGAAWGALIGHFVKTERWTPVRLGRANVRVSPMRAKGGLGLKVALSW
jgi:hypothetical protein